MDKLMIGIDLCDAYTQAAVLGREAAWTLPTVICRKKTAEEWYIGEEAYRRTLMGEGVIVDKLLTLAGKDGTSTISSVKYTGMDLLGLFLKNLVELVKKEYPDGRVDGLVITLNSLDRKLMDGLTDFAVSMGIPADRVHIVSHTECFVYYVLSQRRDVWGGQVGLFSLSDQGLSYYEMKVVRGPRQTTVWAEQEKLEESFDLSVLDDPAGARMADKILCACGDRLLQKKMFSSVFLTGKGFEKTDWAPDFMKQICGRRRVFAEPALFAKGAVLKAEESLKERSSYPLVCLCEGKVRSTVTMEVLKRDSKVQMALVSAGESWYEAGSVLDVIVDGQNELEMLITPQQDPKKKRIVKIPLEGFPSRDDKTCRIRIATGFLDEKTMVIQVTDQGFGEIYPSTGRSLRQEVMV